MFSWTKSKNKPPKNNSKTNSLQTKFPKELSNQIYVINIDEERKIFSKDESYGIIDNFVNDPGIKLKEKSMIVVCSQNSLSKTWNHFQHWFSEYTKEDSSFLSHFELISKIDATPQNRLKRNFFTKNSNVRIRIYFNTKSKNLLKGIIFEKKTNNQLGNNIKFTNSYNKKDPKSLTNTRSNVLKLPNPTNADINKIMRSFTNKNLNKNKYLITGYGIDRKTIVNNKSKSDDEGIITIGFRFSKYIPKQPGYITGNYDATVKNYFLYISNKSDNYSNSNNLTNLKNKLLDTDNRYTKIISINKNTNNQNVKKLKISKPQKNNETTRLLNNVNKSSNYLNGNNNNSIFKNVVDDLNKLTGLIISGTTNVGYTDFLPNFNSNYNKLLKGEFKDFMDMMISILLIYKIMTIYRKHSQFRPNDKFKNDKKNYLGRINNVATEMSYKTLKLSISSYTFKDNNTNNNKQSFLDNVKFIVNEFIEENEQLGIIPIYSKKTHAPKIFKEILTEYQKTEGGNTLKINAFKNYCLDKLLDIHRIYYKKVN